MQTRNILFYAPGVLLAFGIAVSACPGGTGGEGEKDAGPVVILDGGSVGEGEGEGEGGEGEGGEGEGEGGFQLCDGGLCPDSGITGQEYSGVAEPGVKCDGVVCDVGVACCVALAFPPPGTCAAGVGVACDASAFASVSCDDGPDDCQPGEECCFDNQAFKTTCVAAGTCEGDGNHATVCTDTSECLASELCCGLAGGASSLPVDLGACAPAANNCGF